MSQNPKIYLMLEEAVHTMKATRARNLINKKNEHSKENSRKPAKRNKRKLINSRKKVKMNQKYSSKRSHKSES
jgi:hypothetical protein